MLIMANSEAHEKGALVTSSDVRNMLLPGQSISRFAAIWFDLRPIKSWKFAIPFLFRTRPGKISLQLTKLDFKNNIINVTPIL